MIYAVVILDPRKLLCGPYHSMPFAHDMAKARSAVVQNFHGQQEMDEWLGVNYIRTLEMPAQRVTVASYPEALDLLKRIYHADCLPACMQAEVQALLTAQGAI